MNIKELFRDSSNVFECDSVDEAIAMFKIAHDLGLKWYAGQSYTDEDLIREYWRVDGKEQVFRVATGYRNTSKKDLLPGDKVYKFSELIKQGKMKKGFTKQDFLDKKVAIEWEDDKAEKINTFLKGCHKNNTRATGHSKYYYTESITSPGYYNGVDTVTRLREEGIRRHYKIDELIQEDGKTVPLTQKISRDNLGKIYPEVCSKWKDKIDAVLAEQKFATEIEVSEEVIKEAFKEANGDQKTALRRYFKEPKPSFQAKDLKVGEIMKVTGKVSDCVIGKHVMRIYDGLVCLEDPWLNVHTNTIEGTKLAAGLSVLIAAK